MLISYDMMNVLQKHVSPAQLCVIRVMGSDNEYVLRVRYDDVHLDYPLWMEGLTPEPRGGWEEVAKALTVMGKMVMPPGAVNPHLDSWSYVQPAVLAPMHEKEFRFGKW